MVPLVRRRTILCGLAALPLALACAKRSLASMRVFADHSAREAMLRAAHEFEILKPGLDVILEFGESKALGERIGAGEVVDAFVAASEEAFVPVTRIEGATHELEIATSPLLLVRARGRGLGEEFVDTDHLEGARFALADPETAFGRYSRALIDSLDLAQLAADPLVVADPSALVEALKDGRADVGVLFEVDHRVYQRNVAKIPLPEGEQVEARFLATSFGGGDEGDGGKFVHLLRTEEGRKILRSVGFKTK